MDLFVQNETILVYLKRVLNLYYKNSYLPKSYSDLLTPFITLTHTHTKGKVFVFTLLAQLLKPVFLLYNF